MNKASGNISQKNTKTVKIVRVKVEHILSKVNLSKLLNIVKWVNLMIK